MPLDNKGIEKMYIVDLEAIRAQMDNDDELLLMLFDALYRQVNDALEAAEDAIATDRAADAEALVHKAKGGAASLLATQLHQALADLDSKLKKGAGELAAEIDACRVALRALQQTIADSL